MRNSNRRLQETAGHGREGTVGALLALTICLLIGPGATAARGAGGTEDLDASIAAAVAAVPPERSAQAIRFLLETQLGTADVHAVSPGSLWDYDPAEQTQFFDAVAGGYISSQGPSTAGGCRYVPLHLRGDATLTGLVILFIDDGVGDLSVQIRRKATATNASAETLAFAISSGASSGHRIATDLTITNGAIDNAGFAYFLWVCFPYFDLVELHGIYLTFTS